MNYPVRLGAFISLFAAAGGATPLSVRDAVSQGLKNNFGILIAKNLDAAAQNNRALGPGAMLPVTGVEGTLQSIQGETFDESSRSASADLSWTLFDGFRMFYAYGSLNARARLSSLQMRDAVERTAVEIIEAYYRLVTQNALLKVAEDQVAISENRLKRMQVKKEVGAATQREVLNARVAFNADRAALLNQTLAVITARNALNLSLARPPAESLEVAEAMELPGDPGAFDGWFSAARGNNAALGAEEQKRRVEKLNADLARAAFWPAVAAFGSLSHTWADKDPGGGSDFPSSAMGLTLKFNLLNGLKDVVAAKNAGLSLQNADFSKREAELLLESLVFQQWHNAKNAREEALFEAEGLDLARENLSLSTQQFELGKIDDTQFREAQQALLRAAAQHNTAKFRALVSRSELERLAGKLRIE